MLADLIALLRDVLISKVHPQAEATDESLLGKAIPQEKLLVLLDHFGEAEGRLRWVTDKKLQLEVAVIKSVHLLEEASLCDVLDVLAGLREGVATRADSPPAAFPRYPPPLRRRQKHPNPGPSKPRNRCNKPRKSPLRLWKPLLKRIHDSYRIPPEAGIDRCAGPLFGTLQSHDIPDPGIPWPWNWPAIRP
jgi:hypothetical protein